MYLGAASPLLSCGIPENVGGGLVAFRPAGRTARLSPVGEITFPYFALLRAGFTVPPQLPASAVSSYLAVSPLPPLTPQAAGEAVCFLWHFPSACRRLRGRSPPSCYEARCSAEFGLSSLLFDANDKP